MPQFDVTPLVYVVVALVVVAFLLALFIRVEPPAAVGPQQPPLLTQEFAPGATVEQPTPYYVAPVPESPDPLEVSANTDRKALLGIALLFGLFALTGAYYTLQTGIPIRVVAGSTLLDQAKEKQLDVSIERGANIYASLCFDCHGKRGEGSQTAGLPGLPLNKPDFQASCGPNGQDVNGKKCKQNDDDKQRDFITKTVARGRARPAPAISMPPWLRDDGGTLNQEQIYQVVSFIMYGNWDRILQLREELGLVLEPNPPKPPVPTSPEQLGKTIVSQTCVVCHSFERGKNSPNPAAPNLGAYASEGPFTDQLKALRASDKDWLKKWVADAPSIKPGTAMPKWQGILTEDQINGVVAYLNSLK